MKNEIIIFDNQNVKLEVNLKDETVWLSAEQMGKLFDRDYKTIRKHINNALKEELDNSTVAKFATTTKHGAIKGKTQTHMVDYYNLDMIISVGYRVKSQNGIIFRKWANKVLKEYLIKGYAVNKNRLAYLEKTVKLLDIANRSGKRISGDEAKEILNVISKFSKALDLLDDYDHRVLKKVDGSKVDLVITYEECMNVIEKLRFNNESSLFALERDNNFKSIIKDIYGTFGGVDVYPTIEEKCANVLYLTVKNHAFIDGNKRIAATIFIYFLNRYNILYKNDTQVIDNNTLASITLLIAESNPKEKELMIDLIMNFLNNEEEER